MQTHNDNDCENETLQNLMKIVEYLATDVFRPSTEKEICNALDIPQRKATWALNNLATRGWTEHVAGGWRLAPRIVKVSDAVRINFLEAVSRYLE
jgi:DNA-binding IclR family transcriptional regulator